MTTPSPVEQFNSTIRSIQSDFSSLQSTINLAEARSALAGLDAKIKGLPLLIRQLRDRKYAFGNSLELQSADLNSRWLQTMPGVTTFIDQQAPMLTSAMLTLEGRVNYLPSQASSPEAGLTLANEVKVQIDQLEDRVRGVVNTAHGMYEGLEKQYNDFQQELDIVKYTLDRFELMTSVTLLPTETPVRAVKATWTRDNRQDREDPEGVLYLTDQRMIFEQRQEVATKKVLFITTEKRLVIAAMLICEVNYITDVTGTKQGLFKNEDYLTFTASSGAPFQQTSFHIFDQDFQSWIGIVNRVRSHEIDKDRVIKIDEEVVEKVKKAPTICPACGALFTKPVLRGQDSITCEYCGNVVRL